jgi:TATA-binding protein-associated factor Taf7
VDTAAIQLAKQIINAKTDVEKDKLKDKLKETLTKRFDDRQKRHEKELEALEAQVKKLKEMVSKRQENKKEIIEEAAVARCFRTASARPEEVEAAGRRAVRRVRRAR